MCDRPVPPPNARILAMDKHDRPALFQIGADALGLTGHPGFKTAMAEDLIMEFEEAPESPAPTLRQLQPLAREIEDPLVPIMIGIIKCASLFVDQRGRRLPRVIRVDRSLCLPRQGVAGFTGIGGSFRLEWVAALPWNQWQAWAGIRTLQHSQKQGLIQVGHPGEIELFCTHG